MDTGIAKKEKKNSTISLNYLFVGNLATKKLDSGRMVRICEIE